MAKFNVFVSHSHFDNEFCHRLINDLYQRIPELSVFYDETELHGGEEWIDRLQKEVVKRSIFIVILSPKSVEAPWVREETLLALNEAITERGRRWIIPVRYKVCDVKLLAPILAHRQIIDCTQNEPEGFEKLARAVHSTLDQPPDLVIGGPQRQHESVGTDSHEQTRKAVANIQHAYEEMQWANVMILGRLAIKEPDNANDAQLWGEVGHALLEIGRRDHADEKLKEAEHTLENAVQINNQRADHWRLLAQVYAERKQVQKALEAWTKALYWQTSDSTKIETYREMCIAARESNLNGRSRDFADAAVEMLEVAELPARFEFGWHYWGDIYVSLDQYDRAISAYDRELNQRPDDKAAIEARNRAQDLAQKRTAQDKDMQSEQQLALSGAAKSGTDARTAAFIVLQTVLSELKPSEQSRKFPPIVAGLQSHDVHYRNLGYTSFKDFMSDAANQGYVKVVWLAERSLAYLPNEPVPPHPVQASQPSRTERSVNQTVVPAQIMATIDYLEKSQPFLTWDRMVEYFKKKRPQQFSTIEALLTQWRASGEFLPYETKPMYVDHTGEPQRLQAIRLNRESTTVTTQLLEARSSNSSSWESASQATRVALIATLDKLSTSLPYLTWNHLRTFLPKEDKSISWNDVIASAVDAGVVLLYVLEVPQSEQPYTIKSISMNFAHSEVVATRSA